MTSLKIKQYLIITGLLLSTSACQLTSGDEQSESKTDDERLNYTIGKPFLQQDIAEDELANQFDTDEQIVNKPRQGFERLESITRHNVDLAEKVVAQNAFKAKEAVKISANNMMVNDFIHYVFGEILGVNYVVDSAIKDAPSPVSLNIQNTLPSDELYSLVAKLLAQKQIRIEFNESTFFFHKQQESKGAATVGVGREYASVPNAGGQILQVVQMHYGIKIALERTLNKLVDAEFIPDFDQNAMFILGNRTNVIRALELINMLDVPAHRGKYIGLLSLQYIAMDDFINQAVTLLTNEGIDAAINSAQNKSVLLVPLSHIGAVAVFASSEQSLGRVQYWASVLDRPSQGENVQYFIYSPKYARASDLGESISGLMGISTETTNAQSTGSNAASLASNRRTSSSAGVGGLDFVVDERTNNLIFNTSGDRYLKILPLLQRLDVLPRQILLEVMIAEVTLTDRFRYGVEFALENDERFNLSTTGFGAGSGALQLSLADADLFGTTAGTAELAFFRENSLVNVLSNPTLLVRDGMSANIMVGSEIPIQTATIGGGQGFVQGNIEYTQTGVQITVTPTLNAQGVVIMTIDQTISNVEEASVGQAAPLIFNRSLSTEAVVESGKTVLLGGLISENSSNGETAVPLLADLPLIGHAFRGQSDSRVKTELVMIVTPKVITSSDDWDKLMDDFADSLEVIKFQE